MKNPFIQSSPSDNNQAKVKLVLRVVVALYILYMTKALITSAVKGTSPLPLWVTVLVSTVFISASVVFGLYAWKEYKHSLALAAKENAESDLEDSQDDDNE
ncbi:MAG TPA: hypothetical protein VHO94_02505 [Oscillospiraceae bacterium]|nr:hypothetical protein [Oscillospiraceae bacterium]